MKALPSNSVPSATASPIRALAVTASDDGRAVGTGRRHQAAQRANHAPRLRAAPDPEAAVLAMASRGGWPAGIVEGARAAGACGVSRCPSSHASSARRSGVAIASRGVRARSG